MPPQLACAPLVTSLSASPWAWRLTMFFSSPAKDMIALLLLPHPPALDCRMIAASLTCRSPQYNTFIFLIQSTRKAAKSKMLLKAIVTWT